MCNSSMEYVIDFFRVFCVGVIIAHILDLRSTKMVNVQTVYMYKGAVAEAMSAIMCTSI